MREYRDDDVRDEGFCPFCGRLLLGVTAEGKAYCVTDREWVFVDWGRPREADNEEANTAAS